MHNKLIPLFWYSLYKFNKTEIFSFENIRCVLGIQKENYGDLLSKYIVEKISNKKTIWVNPNIISSKNYFVIGSILNYCNEKSIIWGSGIINKEHSIKKAEFKAVRGPLTRQRIIDLGFDCPEIYGDPGLLISKYYKPKIPKKYKLGIVPHFFDLARTKELYEHIPEIKIINLITNNIEITTDEILSCEKIISSSLHGLITAHSYQIPAVWVKFGNKLFGDNVKFDDYLLSVEIEPYEVINLNSRYELLELIDLIDSYTNLPNSQIVNDICEKLTKNCPFINYG